VRGIGGILQPEPTLMTADALGHAAAYPLLDALRLRRSRRFGLGMAMSGGPLAHRSTRPGMPLADDEEALLAFAACGVTGPALADLDYSSAGGGTIMAGLAGRTVPSGDAIQVVAVAVINDRGTWLLRRPRDFAPEELAAAVELTHRGEFTELYRRSRVQLGADRAAPSTELLHNISCNRWSLYDPASTYFLPISELTALYINGVLEVLGEATGAFLVDERRGFRPAGLARFARRRGGWLHDDPKDQRVFTIQQVECLVTEFAACEQGMVLQNLGLMTQALGLGGFPHWAAHPFSWFEALGCRMRAMPASRYLGMGRWLGALVRLLGRDLPVPLVQGLELDGVPLLVPYCPPWFPDMAAAVRAVVDLKFGELGVFRKGAAGGAWRDASALAQAAAAPSERTVAATIAYCDYVHRHYGRFPAYQPPLRTVLGYQASHLDLEFYDRHYTPQALSATQREHMQRWHAAPDRR
jgi:hypothetical protein